MKSLVDGFSLEKSENCKVGMGSNQDFANASRIELGIVNASQIIKLRIANQFAS